MSDSTKTGNGDYVWSKFDSEAYFQHYYGEPHPDDDAVITHTCAALRGAAPLGQPLEMIDVGTGPNLFPLMCAMTRASRITAWEYSESNVAWLRSELDGGVLRPQWQHFWNVVRTESHDNALPENPIESLQQRTNLERGSIYELPASRWDAATMFFCAESITQQKSEFELACVRFAECVRPGGLLAAAFLVGSSGYEVAGRPFPVLNVSEEEIVDLFGSLTDNIRTTRIGIVETEIRSGYSGMVFLTANAR